MWIWWGTYGLSAFQTVVSHFGAGLAGKKSDAKYIEKPIYEQAKKNTAELTEEEKREETEMLFAQLKLMETNYNLKHKDGNN